ncbi:hypothetical protein RclHR1_05970018 [Rhizophagus clarus]|uniref:Uncharacterized protein n=1 Tax=Rhizophagus clarus TaxID=94130 RepID=A0A2Z6RRU3_9GLOM|nr:hypothetical protein RclHR1_05970018 [Rhizophagus clarus]
MDKSQFMWVYPIIEKFAKCLAEYHIYSNTLNIEISNNHQLEIPVRLIEDSISIKIYDAAHFFPSFQPSKKYGLIHQNMPDNIYYKFGIFCYSSGNNAFHACFLWRVDENLDEEEITSKSYVICDRLKYVMPTYHTQFMRTQFKNKADLILGMPTKIIKFVPCRPEQFPNFILDVKQYLEEHAATYAWKYYDDIVLSDMESEEEVEEELNENPFQEDTNVGTSKCAVDNVNQELKNVLSKVFVNASLECYNEMEKAYY